MTYAARTPVTWDAMWLKDPMTPCYLVPLCVMKNKSCVRIWHMPAYVVTYAGICFAHDGLRIWHMHAYASHMSTHQINNDCWVNIYIYIYIYIWLIWLFLFVCFDVLCCYCLLMCFFYVLSCFSINLSWISPNITYVMIWRLCFILGYVL